MHTDLDTVIIHFKLNPARKSLIGVPLAREHRRLMEQIKMQEMDRRTLSNLMKAENS